jgi:hypothetical protein
MPNSMACVVVTKRPFGFGQLFFLECASSYPDLGGDDRVR